jgi:lysophospholipase L1-like esterase
MKMGLFGTGNGSSLIRLLTWIGLGMLGFRLVARAADQPSFYLHDGDRVVFYGDSITDQRLYTVFVEAFVVTRFPKLNVAFRHAGWSADTVDGGYGGNLATRVERDVSSFSPTVVTVMLGMNDGGYRPFDAERFEHFQSGYAKLVQALREKNPNVRITSIQPSPYDDVTRPPEFPGGYNGVLMQYGEFLQTFAKKNHLDLADLNQPVVAALDRANKADPQNAAKIIPDRVHPSDAGHLLLAAALLHAWNAPATVTDVAIDAETREVVRSRNAKVQMSQAKGISWTQDDEALPMAGGIAETKNDPEVLLAKRSASMTDTLNREMLAVTGLPEGVYGLRIDGDDIGRFTSARLNSGVNLAEFDTPMSRQSAEVLLLTLKHNHIHHVRSRFVEYLLANDPVAHKNVVAIDLAALETELIQLQRATAIPRRHRFELAKVE